MQVTIGLPVDQMYVQNWFFVTVPAFTVQSYALLTSGPAPLHSVGQTPVQTGIGWQPYSAILCTIIQK